MSEFRFLNNATRLITTLLDPLSFVTLPDDRKITYLKWCKREKKRMNNIRRLMTDSTPAEIVMDWSGRICVADVMQ